MFGNQRKLARNRGLAGRDGARPLQGNQSRAVYGGVRSPRPTGGCGEPPRLSWVAAHSGASAPAVARKWVGIRPFSDGRGFGPPYLGHGFRRPNFVPKFGASVRSSCPTESPINHPSQPARSEASAPAAARDGRESTQGPSQKGGPPPRLPGQRLAKRKARKEKLVKFSLCPMTSECSTAYNVWKSQQSPARAHAEAASIEQNGLEPHPAARQDASRARNCAATGVFSFDGSTAVFFLAPQKENGGGNPTGLPRHHQAGCGHPALRVQRWWCQAAGRCGHRPLRATAPFAQGRPGPVFTGRRDRTPGCTPPGRRCAPGCSRR